jgi:hypothetical protein
MNCTRSISRHQKPLTRNEIEDVTARIYLDSGKTLNALTRDLNELANNKWLIVKENQYHPAIERILQRLPFSIH